MLPYTGFLFKLTDPLSNNISRCDILVRMSSVKWTYNRNDSRFSPSQWETSLQSNAVSHWLGANIKSGLIWYHIERSWNPAPLKIRHHSPEPSRNRSDSGPVLAYFGMFTVTMSTAPSAIKWSPMRHVVGMKYCAADVQPRSVFSRQRCLRTSCVK